MQIRDFVLLPLGQRGPRGASWATCFQCHPWSKRGTRHPLAWPQEGPSVETSDLCFPASHPATRSSTVQMQICYERSCHAQRFCSVECSKLTKRSHSEEEGHEPPRKPRSVNPIPLSVPWPQEAEQKVRS